VINDSGLSDSVGSLALNAERVVSEEGQASGSPLVAIPTLVSSTTSTVSLTSGLMVSRRALRWWIV
jgi:hypothetical protein